MDRNRFLELAAQCANGKNAEVRCGDALYNPISYTITPKAGGKYGHSVLLKDVNAFDSYRRASLDEVEEVRG